MSKNKQSWSELASNFDKVAEKALNLVNKARAEIMRAIHLLKNNEENPFLDYWADRLSEEMSSETSVERACNKLSIFLNHEALCDRINNGEVV